MKIIVASTNPVKIKAISQGFERMFPGQSFDIEGASVASGVPDQPMSDQETYQGAINRVKAIQVLRPTADYWAGIEGGLEQSGSELRAFAWIIITSSKVVGKARTETFILPPAVSELVKQGKELSVATDMVFETVNIKHKEGTVGLLTEGLIDRTSYYTNATILALIPHKNPGLYERTNF